MSLEGLRAWIGEVERKLGMRTRVFLALVVIAIGLGGAAIYLAIDARESSVSESDVQALQERLETRMDELGAAAAATPPAEAEPESVEPESTPEPEPQSKSGKKGKGGASEESSGGLEPPSGATGGAAGAAKLQELVEQAEKKSAEADQAGK